MEPHDPPRIVIFFWLRCLVRNSATSIPSWAMRSTVIVGSIEGPFLVKVLPAPRWSHCTSVKDLSHPAYMESAYGLNASPGPPCKMSTTELLRSLPLIVIH